MALDPAVAAKIEEVRQAVSDAVDKEVGDVKALITAGASPQAVLDALDVLKSNLTSKVDTIDVTAGEHP